MRLLVISNIPSPYRIDFFNELGKYTDLTVVFEAKSANKIKFNLNIDGIKNFKAIFLKEGDIKERVINWKVLKYVNKNDYDFIFVTSYSYATEMLALIYLKIKRIPYILEVDGGFIRSEIGLKKFIKTLLISNAKAYFSPSDSTDNYLLHYGAKLNNIYRYPFTSLRNSDILVRTLDDALKQEVKNKLGIDSDKVILSVGRYIYSKGFDVLLKACANLSNDTSIYIVGDKPSEEYLTLIEKFDLQNVHFIDFKSKDELADYYIAADIFVLPTREDIWGLVINEAMAKGLPVITTDKCVAGLELIEDGLNGYIVQSENVHQLATKIQLILKEDELRLRMSCENLKKISKYTIEEMAKTHLTLLQNLKFR